ncbi:MAG TPA: energy transducer TonB [Flavitalea sp.]|nr:energy transducer TonB [Flavitalea sp.]
MKPLIILLTLLPLLSLAQKVQVNEYDKFTKQRRIELQPVRIYTSGKANVNISYSASGSVLYLQLSGAGWGASAVDEGQELLFLCSNDSIVSAKSTAVQTAEVNSSFQTAFKHSYFVKMSDVKLLSGCTVIGLRKYGLGDEHNLKIPMANALKIKSLSALFLEELRIGNIFRNVQEIPVSEVAKHVGDSVRFCTKVYNARYFQSVANKPTVLDVNDNPSSPLNVIIWEQDRKNFGNAPEILYNQKEVCITGLVQSYNNLPQIVVKNRNQISLKSSLSLAEVDKFTGDSVTVAGRVMGSKFLSNSPTSPLLLNLTSADPNKQLTVLINSKDRGNFGPSPESYFLNKDIKVTGKVEMYGGEPQIVVQSKNQITEVPLQMVQAKDTPQAGQLVEPVTNPGMANTGVRAVANKSGEKAASFPGGQDALLSFIKSNVVCPESELQMGEKKVVVAKFLIKPDGTASDIQITQPGGNSFDREVIRVLKMMPKWEPHMSNGTAVPVSVTQPFTFARPGK